MPLPSRVPERDLGATRVAPAAYIPPFSSFPPVKRRRWLDLGAFSGCGGCLIRMSIMGLFVVLALLIAVVTLALYQYYALAATLPSVADLQAQGAQFETTRILDRQGNQLYEILDPQAGRRTYVPLERISPFMVAATISTEDSQFYSHPGFDVFAIARAIWQGLGQGESVSGASTITQQIARNLLLTPEERGRRTALRKIREIMLAAEITRRYTKDEILELYLNQVYFGSLAYGVQAAAESYFNTSSDRLTLPQATFLAGLIQAPSVYDIFANPEATLNRHRQVLSLMVVTSSQQGCIYVSNSQAPICVGPEDAGAAAAEITNYPFRPSLVQIRYPHWVNYIRSELERLYDPQTIYRSGFTVFTTLDPTLQDMAQQMVSEQIQSIAQFRASNGALVAIRPSTGEILAMVGSADFNNEQIDGQINMALRPRQPGSSIKPLTYTAAFEKGWTASTLIWDVPSEFPPSGNPSDLRPPYKPVNYDERFHGPVLVRTALANSYNVPAVKTLQFVGIYDNPDTPQNDGLIAVAERMGITTLTRDDYGLSLTLGGGDVTLFELTGAYAVFANNGVRMPPYAITRIVDFTGKDVYEYQPPAGEQVIRSEHAYLITSILSDNAARTPAFGPNSLLNLPFPAAAKTGTTNDFRDNWTLGFTPDLAVGVWVGNADYTPMQNITGMTGAAPVWNRFMQAAVQRLVGGPSGTFSRPGGIVEKAVCAISGNEPSEWCPSHKVELFASDQPPLAKEQDLWQKAWVDSWSLERASADCPEFAKEKVGLNVVDTWARRWIKEDSAGKEWLQKINYPPEEEVFFVPDRSCTLASPRPIISLTYPLEGATISSAPLTIFGQAAATANFEDWVLQYGIGFEPVTWTRILRGDVAYQQPEKLVDWDPVEAGNGPITLRLVVRSSEGGNAERLLHLNISLPTATPAPTLTPTLTLTPSLTPTLTPTLTSTPLPSPTPTPVPTETPTPSETPTPTNTPT